MLLSRGSPSTIAARKKIGAERRENAFDAHTSKAGKYCLLAIAPQSQEYVFNCLCSVTSVSIVDNCIKIKAVNETRDR
jgi:hypothetical protein